MISFADAQRAIASLEPLSLTEILPLARALGHWNATPIALNRDQPPFDRATMDGYAVVLAGDAAQFTVIGTVHAGESWTGAELLPGQAVRIMTGAPAPQGTTVIPIEATDAGLEQVTIADATALTPKKNIAWRGEDGHQGDVVVNAPIPFSPTIIAAAAMCGTTTATCWRPPRCAIITTGDEVGGSGDAAIADSNGPLLESLLISLGIPCTRRHARDDANHLQATLASAALEADIVITTGGVSAGAKDLVPDIAALLNFSTVFHHVAIQPGKPVFLARRDAPRGSASMLIGLPGNPVSVLATAHLFVLPLLGRFLGGWQPTWTELPLAQPFQHRGRRHLFLPATVGAKGVSPIAWNGSGDLLAAAAGDGVIDLPLGFAGQAGDGVRFLPYVGSSLGCQAQIPPRSKR